MCGVCVCVIQGEATHFYKYDYSKNICKNLPINASTLKSVWLSERVLFLVYNVLFTVKVIRLLDQTSPTLLSVIMSRLRYLVCQRNSLL